MTNKEKDKRYQFVSLCISLTKQGFRFYKQKGVKDCLVFSRHEGKKLLSPETKTPFVNAFLPIAHDKNKIAYQFEQWAGR